MDIISVAFVSAVNILCFMIGAKVGQTVVRGEKILPPFSEVVREKKEKAKQEQERDRIATILQNIDNYDGTTIGQREVPKG